MTIENRYIRQEDLVPAPVPVTVIGVGAIGKQVAMQLAAMGVDLQIIDPQKVAPENLAAQGYFEDDLGKYKVAATGSVCGRLNSEVTIRRVAKRFKRSQKVHPVVFCCVDSIEARQMIWESVSNKVRFFVDGRMSAEVMRILAVFDDVSRKYYPETFFAGEEAFQEGCTQKSTVYCANVAAGYMVTAYVKWLRGAPLDADVSINLLAFEHEVVGEGGLK